MSRRDVVGMPSERQITALELLAADLSQDEAALKLCVKPGTIGTYLAHSAEALGVRHTPAAIHLAGSSGLIPLSLSRLSVPGTPFRELVSIASALRTATPLDLPSLQARATTALATLYTQNTPTWALCNRVGGSIAPR